MLNPTNRNYAIRDFHDSDLAIDLSEEKNSYLVELQSGKLVRMSHFAYYVYCEHSKGTKPHISIRNWNRNFKRNLSEEQWNAALKLVIDRVSGFESIADRKTDGFWFRCKLLNNETVSMIAHHLRFMYSFAMSLVLVITSSLLAVAIIAAEPIHISTGFCSLLLFLISLIVHEFGHATACARFGAAPSSIGFAVYLIYPVLFSDVGTAWKLRRWQRVVVDLGGIYFQIWTMNIYAALYLLCKWPPLLSAIWLNAISCFVSLNPILKFDGYWVVADALGVTNLSQQPLRVVDALRKGRLSALPWPKWVVYALMIYTVASALGWGSFIAGLAAALVHQSERALQLVQQLYLHKVNTKGNTVDTSIELAITVFMLSIVVVGAVRMLRQLPPRLQEWTSVLFPRTVRSSNVSPPAAGVVVGFGLLALVSGSAVASPPELPVLQTSQAIRVDGRLDESVWKQAETGRGFTQKTPTSGAAPSEQTSFSVVHDSDALYVGVHCQQSHSPVVRRLTRRDNWSESDSVTFAVDSRHDHTTAFEFTITAAGVQIDGVRFNDTELSEDWDEVWESAAAIVSDGWSVEFRIPFRVLRFDPQGVQDWGIQLRRYISRRQETDEWSFIPRTESGEVSRFGTLKGLDGLRARQRIEVRPFVSGRLQWVDSVPAGDTPPPQPAMSLGLDLKIHLSNSLTLDGTIFPDFGQVEADRVVLNLTTYEQYFPEKRPFFLEGIDVLNTPMQIIYTRRIGRPPSAPVLLDTGAMPETALSQPQPTTLLGALKLQGTIGSRVTVGLLSGLGARNEIRVRNQIGIEQNRLADPMTLWNALRLKLAVGANAHVGVLVTTTNRFERAEDYPSVDATAESVLNSKMRLCPSGFKIRPDQSCFNDAYVAAVDGRWRSSDGNYSVNGQVLVTALRRGLERTYLDGTIHSPSGMAPGASLRFAKEGGEHWIGGIGVDVASRNLDYNDLGYMQRQNLVQAQAGLAYRTTTPWWVTLATTTRLDAMEKENLDGQNIGRQAEISTEWQFRNFWSGLVLLRYRPSYLEDREVGDGTALERKSRAAVVVNLNTDPRRMLSVQFGTQLQFMDRGFRLLLNSPILFSPIAQLLFEFVPQADYSVGEPRFIAMGSQPGEYLFGILTARSVGAVLRASYTFTPRLTLQLFGQTVVSARSYSDVSRVQTNRDGPRPVVHLDDLHPLAGIRENYGSIEPTLNLSAVLRWEYLPGSVLYLVYTRSQGSFLDHAIGDATDLNPSALKTGPASNAVLLKISYWAG